MVLRELLSILQSGVAGSSYAHGRARDGRLFEGAALGGVGGRAGGGGETTHTCKPTRAQNETCTDEGVRTHRGEGLQQRRGEAQKALARPGKFWKQVWEGRKVWLAEAGLEGQVSGMRV